MLLSVSLDTQDIIMQFEKENSSFASFNQLISKNTQDFSQTLTHFKKKNSSSASFNQSISMNTQDFSQTFTHFKKKNLNFMSFNQLTSLMNTQKNNTQVFKSVNFKTTSILMSVESYLILRKCKINKSLQYFVQLTSNVAV